MASDPLFHLPRDDEHCAIIGRNGSGKTQAAVWQLSERSFDKMPWIVFNTKGDELIDDIPISHDISITGTPPKHPGIYIARPAPHQIGAFDTFMSKVWDQQRTGIYIDEGYMVKDSDTLNHVLTQGRSRRLPVIILTQRPVWISKFVFSEAAHHQVFSLTNLDDRKNIAQNIPGISRVRLPPFVSLWHDVKADWTFRLSPVPSREEILQRFKERGPIKRHIL